jgi:hypothetical protein
MSNIPLDERKVKSNDIVNGVARCDIYDSKGTLLVKEGTRIGEVHFERMREQGLIQQDQNSAGAKPRKLDINYVSSGSLHGRLDKISLQFVQLQKKIISDHGPTPSRGDELVDISNRLQQLCTENIFQVLGELYLAETSQYNFAKPLYVAASLTELINRYNEYAPQQAIDEQKRNSLILAALLYNIGLLQLEANIYAENKRLTPEEKHVLRVNYPAQSVKILTSLGIHDPVSIDAIKHHNVATEHASFDALLLRTPFIYCGIAMPQFINPGRDRILNPCREFTQMFAEKKLDPVLGGLFLKINGLMPVGSIMQFDSREKAMVISGPGSDNITSSQLRILTSKSGMQLSRPGETFYFHKTSLKQKGLADHHQFAWNKFAPFVMWER